MAFLSRISRRAVLTLTLLLVAVPALPQGTGGSATAGSSGTGGGTGGGSGTGGYTVELVLFRNGGEGGTVGGAQRLPVSGDDMTATPVSTHRLGGVVTRLNGGGKRVIAHAAWRQAAGGPRSRRGVSAAAAGLAGTTGKIIIERGTYVLLGLDLVVEDNGRRYRINEMRQQIKVGDALYFDHPAIGAIAMVTAE